MRAELKRIVVCVIVVGSFIFIPFGNNNIADSVTCDRCKELSYSSDTICSSAGNSTCAWTLVDGNTACCAVSGSADCEDLTANYGNRTFYYHETTGTSVTCKWRCAQTTNPADKCDSQDTAYPISGSCTVAGSELQGTAPLLRCE